MTYLRFCFDFFSHATNFPPGARRTAERDVTRKNPVVSSRATQQKNRKEALPNTSPPRRARIIRRGCAGALALAAANGGVCVPRLVARGLRQNDAAMARSAAGPSERRRGGRRRRRRWSRPHEPAVGQSARVGVCVCGWFFRRPPVVVMLHARRDEREDEREDEGEANGARFSRRDGADKRQGRRDDEETTERRQTTGGASQQLRATVEQHLRRATAGAGEPPASREKPAGGGRRASASGDSASGKPDGARCSRR